jgi:glyoxylase-like metal-dependent hydrolase (beta-lactamase superfamily II)
VSRGGGEGREVATTRLDDGVRVVLAPNPGIMTGPGTNQYLFGDRETLLVDVALWGGENAARLAAALGPSGGRVTAIALTHIHPDHVGGAGGLRAASGAPVAVHASRATFALGDRALAPERLLADGDEVTHAAGRLRVVHTPGHESGHCCFLDPDRRWLFTGDLVLGTGTVVIPPPDGDMCAYLASLRRLLELDLARILPGHGPPIERPYEKVEEYLAHRLMRERQILAALAAGLDTVPEIVARLYAEVPAVLHPAAALTVRAHLAKLVGEDAVREDPEGRFRALG